MSQLRQALLLCFTGSLLAGCGADAGQIKALEAEFDRAYRRLYEPSFHLAAPIELERWDSLLRTYRLRLEEMPPKRSPAARQAWNNLVQRLRILKQQIDAYRHSPALYHVGGKLQVLLHADTFPPAEKARRLLQILQQTPAYYRQAAENLGPVSPGEAQRCVQKQAAGIALLQTAVLDTLLALAPSDSLRSKALTQAAAKHLRVFKKACERQAHE